MGHTDKPDDRSRPVRGQKFLRKRLQPANLLRRRLGSDESQRGGSLRLLAEQSGDQGEEGEEQTQRTDHEGQCGVNWLLFTRLFHCCLSPPLVLRILPL